MSKGNSKVQAPADTGSDGEWIAPDSGRQLLVFLGAMLLCLWSLRWMYGLGDRLRQIRQIARHDPEVAADEILALTDSFLLTMSAVLLVLAIYLALQGVRLWRAGQFPIAGSKVVMKTRVVRGPALARRVWTGWVLAVVLAVMGLMMPVYGKEIMLRFVYVPVSSDADPVRGIDPDARLEPEVMPLPAAPNPYSV